MNIILILLLCIGYTLSLPKFPNIGYLGIGYDILQGNPHTSPDNGFKTQPVLELTYYTGKETPDGKYSIPDNVTVLPTTTCTYTASSQSIYGSYSYQQYLMQQVQVSSSVSISSFGASFSASTTFEQARGTFLSKDYRSVVSAATCETYRAAILGYNTSYVFSQEFADAVETLPIQFTPSTRNIFMTFYENFGSHVVMSLCMGAKMSLESVFEESKYKEMEESAVEIKYSASASFSIFSGSFSGTVAEKQKIQKEFDSRRSYVNEIYIGGQPFVDQQHGGINKWRAEAMENPLPMGGENFHISYIGDFLTSQHFPNDYDIDSKRLALESFYSQLCSTLSGCTTNLFDWPDDTNITCSPAIASNGNEVYFISGSNTTGFSVETVKTLQINTTSNWRTIAPIPTPVSRAAAIWSNIPVPGVYVFGGSSGHDTITKANIQFYDKTKNAWYNINNTVLPYPVNGIHCGLLNNSIIIPGGSLYKNGGLQNVYSQVLKFVPNDDSLGVLTEKLVYAVTNYVMVKYNGCLWVIGGWTLEPKSQALPYTQILCDVNGQWILGPKLNYARAGAIASVAGDAIYVMGGYDSTSKQLTNVEVYSPTFKIWGSGSPLPHSRFGTDAVLFHQDYLLIAGGFGVGGNLLYPLGEKYVTYEKDEKLPL